VPESCFAIDTELRVIRVLLDDATIKLNRHEWDAALAVLSNADHRVTLARSWVVGARVCGISCSDFEDAIETLAASLDFARTRLA